MDIRNDYPRLSRNDKIRCMYRWGISVEEIAWEFDLSDTRIFGIVYNNEVNTRRRRLITAFRGWLNYEVKE
jgi:hypothetical protein